jgi:hypothetical protein
MIMVANARNANPARLPTIIPMIVSRDIPVDSDEVVVSEVFPEPEVGPGVLVLVLVVV